MLANAVSSNFESLQWTTMGDGTFSDDSALNPDYYPGAQDVSGGEVLLCLTADGLGNCGDAIDCLTVIITPGPILVPGNNQITICHEESYTFSQVQGFNYNTVQWLTINGGGFFDNEALLNPTYFPSPMIDYPQGCIEIEIVMQPVSPCVNTLQEYFTLCFQQNPVCNAGSDATIAETETFVPSSTASGYASIVWSTSGDGTFSNPSIIDPVYTPGIEDLENGYVSLEIFCQAISPCVISVFDEVELSIIRQLQFEMQAGWQGFSSFIDVSGQNIEEVFAPIADRIIVAQNGTSVYWPEFGINTIGNFVNLKGYKIKLNTSSSLPVNGFVFNQKTVALPQGWSILPVLSGCPVDYSEIISQLGSKLIIVNEIGGTGMIWPANGIFTISQLLPGKAYMIKVTTGCSFTYPLCGE